MAYLTYQGKYLTFNGKLLVTPAPADSVDLDRYSLFYYGDGTPSNVDHVYVTSSGTWNTSKLDTGYGTSWVTSVYPESGNNNDQCTITVEGGYSGYTRFCTVRFTVGTTYVDLEIAQDGWM